MKWKDLRPGTIVYHTIFVHWGKGVVEKVLGVDILEGLFERGKWRAIVNFEKLDSPTRMRANELRKTPNRKKILEMIEFYNKRGWPAEDGGDIFIPLKHLYTGSAISTEGS